MSTYAQFIAGHPAGSRIGDPLLIDNGETTDTMYQCASYVKQYLLEVGGKKIDWPGNAIQFWSNTVQAILDICDRIGDGIPKQGDIAVFKTKGRTDYGGYGHIGLATGTYTDGQMEIWEQNGQTGNGTGYGQDAIRTRWIERSRLAGLLRFKPVYVHPVNYRAEPHPHDVLTSKQPTNWWNLNNTTADINSFHPAQVLNENTPFRIGGYADHKYLPYTYAMTPDDFNRAIAGDYSTNNGINVNDLKAVPKPQLQDYIPAVPKLAETYQLVTTIQWYKSYDNAVHDTDAKGTKDKGTYYVRDKKGPIYELADDNMATDTVWINTTENVVPTPKPVETKPVVDVPPKIVDVLAEAQTIADQLAEPVQEPAKQPEPTYNWQDYAKELSERLALFNTDGSPVYYNSINARPLTIDDMSGRRDSENYIHTTTLKPFTKHIPMVGTVDIREANGEEYRYVLSKHSYEAGMWYLVKLNQFKYDLVRNVEERVERAVNDIKTSEYLTAAQAKVKVALKGMKAGKK